MIEPYAGSLSEGCQVADNAVCAGFPPDFVPPVISEKNLGNK